MQCSSATISLYAGGGSLTVGVDNSTGAPFVTMRTDYGVGGEVSFDENGRAPAKLRVHHLSVLLAELIQVHRQEQVQVAGYLSELKYHYIEEKHMFKKVIISVALVVTVFTVIHIVLEGSEGFKSSSNFLKENKDVIESVGSVSRISHVPLLSSVLVGGHEGNAKYHVKVVGAKGVAEGVVTLVKTGEVWNVTKAHLVLIDGDVVILRQ